MLKNKSFEAKVPSNRIPSKKDFFTIDLKEIGCKIYREKSVLEGTLLVDRSFVYFRLVLALKKAVWFLKLFVKVKDSSNTL